MSPDRDDDIIAALAGIQASMDGLSRQLATLFDMLTASIRASVFAHEEHSHTGGNGESR